MKNIFIVIVVLKLLSSCNEHTDNNSSSENRKLVDTVVKDIPLDKKGRPGSYYQNKSDVENKLGINTLENGFDSLQIRLWYAYAFKDSSQLVILKNEKGSWKAELFMLVYNLNDSGNAIKSISKNIVTREPKSGWQYFINEIMKLQITTLPDKSKIEGYPEVADGDDIIVEVATKTNYRIYTYKEPNQAQNQIKEARSMEQILGVIESEFDFNRLRKL